jgi:D-methionine transport system ATP-binding protein
LRLSFGLSFRTGTRTIGLDPLELRAGEWVVFSPARQALGADLATVVARLLATLGTPLSGTIELFGEATHELGYEALQKLRARLGFVQGHGGLLSNRNLRDNIALPLSIHGNVSAQEEDEQITETLKRFDLLRVALLRPHEVDGATRFRACVARALVLAPKWLVIEGIGDFEAETGASVTWARLLDYRNEKTGAAAVCLTRQSPAFERWLTDQGGQVVRYRLFSEAPPVPERSADT